MSHTASTAQHCDTAAEEFRQELERVLAVHFGRRRRIAVLSRRHSAFASSHRLDEIDIALADGTELQVIGKACGEGGMLGDARRTRPAFLQHPMREAGLYESVLSAIGDNAPISYGMTFRRCSRTTYLLLERVDGLELRRVGDFDVWTRAARQLAIVQDRLTQRLEHLPPDHSLQLVQYGEAYYWRWLTRVMEAESRAGTWSSAVERTMRRLAAGYDRIVRHLCSLPCLVIHGDCFASNILVGEARQARICFVDWEMAGWGPGLVDVAALTAGTWTGREREMLLSAYREGLLDSGSGKRVESLDEMLSSLAMCRLHLAIQMLGWASDWEPPSEQRHDWLGEAMHLAEHFRL